MWDLIASHTKQYNKISLSEERSLIANAQRGSARSKDELLLRHVKFLIFRIHRIVFPDFLRRFGDDLFAEGIKLRKYTSYCSSALDSF